MRILVFWGSWNQFPSDIKGQLCHTFKDKRRTRSPLLSSFSGSFANVSQVRVWLDKLHEKYCFWTVTRIALNSKSNLKESFPIWIFHLFPFIQALFSKFISHSLANLFCCPYQIAYWWLLNCRKKRKGYEDDDYVSKKSKHEEVCSPKGKCKLLLYILVQP